MPTARDTTADRPQDMAAVVQDPLADLWTRFAAGDSHAFDQLVLSCQDAGLRMARRMTQDDDSARDIVQDAFLRVLEQRGGYDPRRPFLAWFLRIVRNLAIDRLRRQKHERTGITTPAGIDHDPGRDSDRRELHEHIHQVLLLLQEKYHDLLVMREIHHLRADHIARLEAVDAGTTRWRIHQAPLRTRNV